MTRSNSLVNSFEVTPLDYLLLAIPVAVILKLSGVPAVWTFLASCVAVIPLAGLMGRATENLAETLGAGIGGLLNATFGNAAELIIALFALSKAGQADHLSKMDAEYRRLEAESWLAEHSAKA